MKRKWDERLALLLTIVGVAAGTWGLIGLARTVFAADAPGNAAPSAPAQRAQEKPEPVSVIADIKSQAAAAGSLCETPLGAQFLGAAASLPEVAPRTIYRDRERGLAITEDAWKKLGAEEQAKFKPRECDEKFYYYTGYGTPLNYARALDLAGKYLGSGSWEGKRILDFGYGSIGHLRMLASLGADAEGVEVEPLFAALYSWPGDQGAIEPVAGSKKWGLLRLHHGHWPGEPEVAKSAGDRYDLFISKNTLKRGYVHPEREADERMLIKLGVDDEAFLKAVYDSLKPGGIMLVYNIAPAQNPPEKPFLPMADGRFPFDRALAEKVGFEVLAFDVVDDEVMHKYWQVYFPDPDMTLQKLKESIFTHYTVLRRK